jgi:hypothetical protein
MWGGSNVGLWRKEREHKCKAACSIPNVTGSTFLGNFLTVIGQVPQPRNKNQKRPDMLQPSYRQSGLWSLVCQASISNVTFKPTARQQDTRSENPQDMAAGRDCSGLKWPKTPGTPGTETWQKGSILPLVCSFRLKNYVHGCGFTGMCRVLRPRCKHLPEWDRFRHSLTHNLAFHHEPHAGNPLQ